MPFSPTTLGPCQWFSHLATVLDPRSGPRLVRLFLGAVLAASRRTITSWLRAAGVTDEFRLPGDSLARFCEEGEVEQSAP